MSKTFPTEFRGCIWDDGWEFDAPCVVYYPSRFATFRVAGNSQGIDDAVEDICIDISQDWPHEDGGLEEECEGRGWSLRGFARRKNAWHVTIKGHWEIDDDGSAAFCPDTRTEVWGKDAVKCSRRVRGLQARIARAVETLEASNGQGE